MSLSLLIMFGTLLLRPSPHCNTPLHFTALHFATLHYTYRHFISLCSFIPNSWLFFKCPEDGSSNVSNFCHSTRLDFSEGFELYQCGSHKFRILVKEKRILTDGYILFCCGTIAQMGPRTTRFDVYKSHTITHVWSPLNEWSTRRKDRYLHKHKGRTSMPSAEFEPAIPEIEQVHTYALDGRTTRIRPLYITHLNP